MAVYRSDDPKSLRPRRCGAKSHLMPSYACCDRKGDKHNLAKSSFCSAKGDRTREQDCTHYCHVGAGSYRYSRRCK
jgi:hypothetical protein